MQSAKYIPTTSGSVLEQQRRSNYATPKSYPITELTFVKTTTGKRGCKMQRGSYNPAEEINDELSMSAAVIEEILDEFPDTMPT